MQAAGRAGPAALPERRADVAPLQRQHAQAAHTPDAAARPAGNISLLRKASRLRLRAGVRRDRGGRGPGLVPAGVRAPARWLAQEGSVPLGLVACVRGLGLMLQGGDLYPLP